MTSRRRPTRDTIEGRAYLARLAVSKHAPDFVLKGGVLLAAFAARRPTRDIELLAGGVAFHLDNIQATTIRDDDDYPGVRANLEGRLLSSRISLRIDISFGDPIWPEPALLRLPLLLGGELPLRGYPVHMVLAEKIATAMSRGVANTRWRDFVDIAAIASNNTVNGSTHRVRRSGNYGRCHRHDLGSRHVGSTNREPIS